MTTNCFQYVAMLCTVIVVADGLFGVVPAMMCFYIFLYTSETETAMQSPVWKEYQNGRISSYTQKQCGFSFRCLGASKQAKAQKPKTTATCLSLRAELHVPENSESGCIQLNRVHQVLCRLFVVVVPYPE